MTVSTGLLTEKPAFASEIRFDPAPTAACVAETPDAYSALPCASRSVDACIEDYGDSTVTMNACLEAGLDYWDNRLNLAYKAEIAVWQNRDPDLTYPVDPVKSLKEMQRSWIPYRDNLCGYEMAQWQGGTGQTTALLHCLLQETARKALYLEWSNIDDSSNVTDEAKKYPFLGEWDCEIATFIFTEQNYNNGLEDLPIRRIEGSTDGSFTLHFDDDYSISLSGISDQTMQWFSNESGDTFDCTRLN